MTHLQFWLVFVWGAAFALGFVFGPTLAGLFCFMLVVVCGLGVVLSLPWDRDLPANNVK